MVNLVDTEGHAILSGPDNWYKIAIADGTELGLTPYKWTPGYSIDLKHGHISAVSPSEGLISRYQRFANDDRLGQGWPIGDKGYLRCFEPMYEHDGRSLNINLTKNVYSNLYDIVATESAQTPIHAEQLGHNRVALYIYDKDGKIREFRLNRIGDAREDAQRVIQQSRSDFLVPFDCEFVKVSTKVSNGLFKILS
ncbi:uncharacterized protein FTJAE_1848 [Fusarium tjaetaba]|uniref:Uncharacterized protein n=1 Tax=Fusarium tjaetaba TaxID=1567544 RepID=A0A8H5SA89_9HYPO|nr:uncharacterized protein FTJAE_1848 [Fusarium tjaetaba]KAF5647017.1 hypothetical protein FTJAE_1848 [Fusarium tjaetaba]